MRKEYLELDKLLASAFVHGAKTTQDGYTGNIGKETALNIRNESKDFLAAFEAAQSSPAAWRTFVRELSAYSYRTESPDTTTELSPEWEALYTGSTVLHALKIGIAIGALLDK